MLNTSVMLELDLSLASALLRLAALHGLYAVTLKSHFFRIDPTQRRRTSLPFFRQRRPLRTPQSSQKSCHREITRSGLNSIHCQDRVFRWVNPLVACKLKRATLRRKFEPEKWKVKRAPGGESNPQKCHKDKPVGQHADLDPSFYYFD